MQTTMTIRNVSAAAQLINTGKPTMPLGRQPVIERKIADPSSSPRVERYPVPSFYEHRLKARDYDPL